jgi:hypothetical protein
LRDRRVAVVAGAGVSISAGLPPWGELVDRVLGTTLARGFTSVPGLTSEELATLVRQHTRASELILAQHSKRELRSGFADVVRRELYRGATGRSPLVSALGSLAAAGRVRSFLTLNFDDCLERELGRRKIAVTPIDTESLRPKPETLPVYHVRGFLPRKGRVRSRPMIFAESDFNEDALDPYRWSSLVQIAHLSDYTCVFVGVSVQDPNLRRLLHVITSRSSAQIPAHFIVRTRSAATDVTRLRRGPRMPASTVTKAAQMLDALDESDLNALGLQVIWVADHNEVTQAVERMATL